MNRFQLKFSRRGAISPKLGIGVLVLIGAIVGGTWLLNPTIAVVNAPPGAGPVIAFGDSLTAGVGASPGMTYPEQLSTLIARTVIAKGVPGETATDAVRRVDRDIVALDPAIVIVCLGGNDILKNKSIDDTFSALDQTVVKSQNSGAMVVLVGVEGISLISGDYGDRFEQLAEKHGCLYVPDIMDGIFGHGDLMADGIHPNDAGYGIFAQRIADALMPYL